MFRVRLVHLLDRLLDLLESAPEYCFTLDGQAIMIDDYLEVRPQNRARIAARVQAGQLAVGPFLILMDEFSCDGETMIRNLEHGLAASRRVGPPMRAAHLPDLFGHVAQMPQILRGFDIAHSVLWRGVPDRVRRHAFAWEAPGGIPCGASTSSTRMAMRSICSRCPDSSRRWRRRMPSARHHGTKANPCWGCWAAITPSRLPICSTWCAPTTMR